MPSCMCASAGTFRFVCALHAAGPVPPCCPHPCCTALPSAWCAPAPVKHTLRIYLYRLTTHITIRAVLYPPLSKRTDLTVCVYMAVTLPPAAPA